MVDKIVASQIAHFFVLKTEHLFASSIQGNKSEIKLMLGLEHDFFVGNFQQRGWTKRCAKAEQSQWSLFGFFVLTMQNLNSAPDIQSLKTRQSKDICLVTLSFGLTHQETGSIVQQTAEADGERAV